MMSVADGVLLVDFSCAHLPDSSGVVAFAVKMKRGTGRVGYNVSPHPVQRRGEQQSTSWAFAGKLEQLSRVAVLWYGDK